MSRDEEERHEEGRRLYKARGPDGEVAWVDHDELWRLQQSQAENLRREHARRRQRLLLILAALVVVALALVFLRLGSGTGSSPAERMAGTPAVEPSPRPNAPETPPAALGDPDAEPPAAEPAATGEAPAVPEDEPAVVSSETEPAATSSEADPAPVPTEAAEPSAAEPIPAADPTDQVAAAVRAWADAWARQDLTAYLGSYAVSFRPPEGMSRSSWQGLRRRRLSGPESIRVEIERIRVTPLEGGRFEARFVQRYTSPRYSDVVDKRLILVEEAGEWRIAAEQAGAPRRGEVG